MRGLRSCFDWGGGEFCFGFYTLHAGISMTRVGFSEGAKPKNGRSRSEAGCVFFRFSTLLTHL